MPRISQTHRVAQEERFIDAARRCFTRLGVEGTSMEQVRTEAGVSAGLMYRYFASKDAMIRAAITTSMAEFEEIVAETGAGEEAATAVGYLQLLLGNLQAFRRHSEGVDLFALAIQGWAHVQSRPEAKSVVLESFARLLATFQDAAAVWGTEDAPATALAIGGAVIGFIVQGALLGADGDVDRYCAGLASLGR
ncbi:MAG: helix-turn-helix domain-containing protein [Mycolicibacterium insubricum]|nr:TetR/AcrR family transcriptional regulator [Mycobacterium sp.]